MKFWLLGIILIVLGIAGILWNTAIPILEKRAAIIGKFKRDRRKSNENN